jgi:hypothetical protein
MRFESQNTLQSKMVRTVIVVWELIRLVALGSCRLRSLSVIVNQGAIEAMLDALVGRRRKVECPANGDVAWRRAGGAG